MDENINPNSENTKKEEEEKIKKIYNSFSLDNNEIDKRISKNNNNQSRKSIDKGKNLGTFILGQKLGEGTFGVVRIATHIITGEKVAVKILDKQKILKESDKSRLEKEIKILKMLHHNNIVHLYNVIQTSSKIYLVMEYIEGKELFDYIIHKRRLSELEACKFYQQLISGIEYLGKLKIAHRDLKPENLLLDKKKNIKLVDFGLSNIYKNTELLSTACGSPSYAAPEMLSGVKYNGLNVDIWSSGIVLYAMICGSLPFEDPNNDNLYKKIKQGIFKTPEFISEKAKDFLHRILNIDPSKRYNIEQIKEHPWFNTINPKIYMSEGLLLNTYIIPIDEDIIDKMVYEYEYNGIEVIINLLANKHNHLTTTYYLLLGKKIRKGEKSICNTCSNEFMKYIHNPENLLSNYNGNWRKLFKERAKDKYKKFQEKLNENKVNNEIKDIKKNNNEYPIINNNYKDNITINIINIKENAYEKINENHNKNNNNNLLDLNKEIQPNNTDMNNNTYNNTDMNNNEKLKTDIKDTKHLPQKKRPPSIFEYIKKIKEYGQKKYLKDENRNSTYSIEPKEHTPKTENTIQSDSLLQSEKNNKKFKEYENKLKIINMKKPYHKYSISSLNNSINEKNYKNNKSKTIFHNLFDIKQYFNNEKKNNNKINKSKNHKSKNIIIPIPNKFNNFSNKNIYIDKFSNKEIINQFLTIEQDSPMQTLNSSKYIDNKHKKKYAESRYFNNQKSKVQKTKENLNNSYKNNTHSRNSSNKKKNMRNYLKNKYIKNKNNLYNKKNSESSLIKRKKYSQSVNSKNKKPKKIKDKNNSTLLINNNIYSSNKTIENKKTDSQKKINRNHINSDYKSRNKENDGNLNVNYIIKNRKIRNRLFNSKNKNKKKFFNTSISFGKTDNETSNDESSIRNSAFNYIKKKDYIFRNENNNEDNINKTNYNSKKSYNEIEIDTDNITKKKLKDQIYLNLKSKNKKFNNNNKNNNSKDKKKNLHNESKNNIDIKNKNKTNNHKKKIINKSISIGNYEEKNKKYNLRRRINPNLRNTENLNIYTNNNGSKNLIFNNYIYNTQRDSKYNKKRKIINKQESDSNDNILIKSLGDNYHDRIHHITYNSNELSYNNNNYTINGYTLDKSNKYICKTKNKYIPLDLNNIIIVNDKIILNQIIKNHLDSRKIKFIIKNCKYLCWKNDYKFTFELIRIDETYNCYVINMNNNKQKNNYFNNSFCKELVGNIINKLKISNK